MFGDASASTASATACRLDRAAPSSSVVAPRGALVSAHSVSSFRSLRGRDTFSRIYQAGVRSRRGGVTVVGAPGESGAPQIGFVAGKRVGNAVRRNRAKRRLRAAMSEVAVPQGMAYIVIAGHDVPDVDYRRLRAWLAAALEGVSAGQRKENA